MQDMLVPIFGENGAIIVQYVITLAVILGLIGLIIWAIRRYGRGSVGPAARGRLPRLAVVDTLAIDGKRRLVLVRRDNVEHLVLVGGPTDVVVEPSIVRQRVAQRPGQPHARRSPDASSHSRAAAAAPAACLANPVHRAGGAARPAHQDTFRRIRLGRERPPLPVPGGARSGPAERSVTPPRRESTRTAMAASALAASERLAEPVVVGRPSSPTMAEMEQEAMVAHEELRRFDAPARSPRGEPAGRARTRLSA